jgi:hypothetical protein
MKRFLYEVGRALRETGLAVDEVGLRTLENPVFKEPCAWGAGGRGGGKEGELNVSGGIWGARRGFARS